MFDGELENAARNLRRVPMDSFASGVNRLGGV